MSTDEQTAFAALISTRVKRLILELFEFYEPNEVMLWLVSRQVLLDGEIPFFLLQTYPGLERVEAVIARLKDGAYI